MNRVLGELTVINLPPSFPLVLTKEGEKRCFVLKTCQRTLLLALGNHALPSEGESFVGPGAYGKVLAIICGLESKILAESEILAQFRQAYRLYARSEEKNPLILSLLEKLLKDGKKIRSQHLKEMGGESYGGIVRKIILTNSQNMGRRLLIKGSGQLAEKLAKTLKKYFDLFATARNPQHLATMSEKFGISPLRWGELELYQKFPLIINAIGAEEIIFDNRFFAQWQRRHPSPLYLDLGSPSVIDTPLGLREGVWSLDHILQMGQSWQKNSRHKAHQAHRAIETLARERLQSFNLNYPFGWEELQFS